jgi:hypothetical protein
LHGIQAPLNLIELRKWFDEEKTQKLQNITINHKQTLSNRLKIVNVEVIQDEMYNEYNLMVSYIELGTMAYVAIFRYDEFECQIKTNMFALISQ